mmetsp:Transcript_19056/g.45734  ORF Transcript_19056/g.45734 Transcript_19056/m.45734 type:complete len:475 (+) Transcript_19056:219-1643(+)
MAQSELLLLHHKCHARAVLVDLVCVLLQPRRQRVVHGRVRRLVKDGLEPRLVRRRDHDDHAVQAGVECLFDEQEDGRLEEAVRVEYREERWGKGLGRREELMREGRRGDERLRDGARLPDLEGHAPHAEVAPHDLHHRLYVLLRLAQQLGAPVALRTHAFRPPDVWLERRVLEHLVQVGRRELRGADWHRVLVEERLRLHHQPAHLRHVASGERLDGRADEPLVRRAKQLLKVSLLLRLGDGVALVQLLQDGGGVLGARQLDDHEVDRRVEDELLAVEPVAVEGHLHRLRAEGTALIHPAALRRRGDLPQVGEVHLSAHRQLQVVHAVERARREHAGGGGRREPFARRKVRLVVVDEQALHVVSDEHLVRHAAHVREVPAPLRRVDQHIRIHWPLLGADLPAEVVDGCEDELVRVRRDLRVQPLVRPGDEAHAGSDVPVEAPVRARPVGVLPHQADPPGDEHFSRLAEGRHGDE